MLKLRFQIRAQSVILAFLVIASVVYRHQKSRNKTAQYYHSIHLTYGPPKQEAPDIWDPPYPVRILGNSKITLQSELFTLPNLPPDLHKWVLVQPLELRGFSLIVSPEATTQDVVEFLDAIKPISDLVMTESQEKLGTPGGPTKGYIWYHSNTNTPCLPLPSPPPPPGLTSPSTLPASPARTQ